MDQIEKSKNPQPPSDGGETRNSLRRYLNEGKEKLLSLEKQITGDKNVKNFLEKADRTGKTLRRAKQQAEKYGSKAERYVKRNPKKAILMAAGAGILAGRIWSALKRDKSVGPAKRKIPKPATPPIKAFKPKAGHKR